MICLVRWSEHLVCNIVLDWIIHTPSRSLVVQSHCYSYKDLLEGPLLLGKDSFEVDSLNITPYL